MGDPEIKVIETDSKLWHCPPILANIFGHLSAQDLSTCSQVCSLWNSMASTEKNRRLHVNWFLETNIGEEIVSDGELIKPQKLYPFQDKLASSYIRPKFCFAFITLDSLTHISEVLEGVPENKPKRIRLLNYDRREGHLKTVRKIFDYPLLPPDCNLHLIASWGIIGCHDNGSPAEFESSHCIAGLLLPDFPGVKIHHGEIDKKRNWEIPDDIFPIKGLLMFTSSQSDVAVQKIVNKCIKSNGGGSIPLGGVIVSPSRDVVSSFFIFSGDNIDMASIVIGQSCKDVAEELSLFKKTGLLEDRCCFVFVFMCVEKGTNLYDVVNYESSVFRSLYPDIPIVGLFGGGEIGMHCLPTVDKDDPENLSRSKKNPPRKVMKGYSSVFVLLSVRVDKVKNSQSV